MAKLKVALTAEEHGALESDETKALYGKGDDGKFYLDADGVSDHPSVRALMVTLKKYKDLGDANALRKRLEKITAFEEALGEVDMDDVPAKLTRLAELEAGKGGPDVETRLKEAREAVKASMTKTHEKEMEPLKTENERLKKAVEKLVVEQALDGALTAVDEHGQPVVLPGVREGAKAVLEKRGPKVVWDGEKPKGVFTAESGEEVPIGTYVGTWLRSDEAKAYQPPSGNEGSGTGNERKGRGGLVNPWMDATFNLTEQGKIVKSNPGLAKQLASAAGKMLEL